MADLELFKHEGIRPIVSIESRTYVRMADLELCKREGVHPVVSQGRFGVFQT